jgi:hypothetical protein
VSKETKKKKRQNSTATKQPSQSVGIAAATTERFRQKEPRSKKQRSQAAFVYTKSNVRWSCNNKFWMLR